MSTIPPYLYAAYSIKDPASEATRLITSVVVEEMLHLALTSNLLLALGGEPDFGAGLLSSYPSTLSHHKPDLPLELRRCTPDLVRDTFMVIERPEDLSAPPEADEYHTLGQFYAALEMAIENLEHAHPFADPHLDRQMSDPTFYGAVEFDAKDSGGLMPVHDAASAKAAIEVIVHQGEGLGEERWADPAHQELTHYYKFAQLADGSVPVGDTWPVVSNPRAADYPPDVRLAADLFNMGFTALIGTMEALYAAGSDQGAEVGRLYGLMSNVLSPTARHLVTMPLDEHTTGGPTFEWFDFHDDPARLAAEMAQSIGETIPALADVASAFAVMVKS
jgi:hypothetical protein